MGRVIAARLRSGDLLREEIQAIAAKEGIAAGVILSAVGSLASVTLRMAGAKDQRTWEEELEIVSITGTVSATDCHIHLAVSREDGSVVGGHLSPGAIVRTTAEITIQKLDTIRFDREPDPETGYDELVVRNLGE
jgi:predicted DNA-binding protein with PD1-like motif